VKELLAFGPGKHRVARGLYLQTVDLPVKDGSTSRTRSWLMRYTFAGRERWMGLGSLDVVGLADATKRVKEERAKMLLDRTYDPIAARDSARTVAVAAEQERRSRAENTFETEARAWIAANGKSWSTKYAVRVDKLLLGDARPLHKLPVADVGEAKIIRVLAPVFERAAVSAYNLSTYIAQVLDRAASLGHRPKGENPARWKGFLEHRFGKFMPGKNDKEHIEALGIDELPGFYQKLAGMEQDTFTLALRFLAVTAVRTDDVLDAHWRDVDFENRIWTCPETKQIKKFKVPLSDEAVKILCQLPQGNLDALVFVGRDGGKIAQNTLRDIMKREWNGTATPHGFRSTLTDWAHERTTIDPKVVDMILAHKIGRGNETEEAYRRGELLVKRADAMQKWAKHLTKPVKAATVTDLDERRTLAPAS